MLEDALPIFDIDDLERDSHEFVFGEFGQAEAHVLGECAAAIILERGLPLAVEVVLGDHVVYKAALGGVSKDTDPWLARKAATARHFSVNSLLVRRRLTASGKTIADHGLTKEMYAAYGGAVVIRVGTTAQDSTVAGTITVSGREDVVDHQIAVEAVRRAYEAVDRSAQ